MSDPGPNRDFVPHSRPDVRIVHLSGPAFRALARGDVAAANAVSPVPISAYLAGPECQGVWRMRSAQFEEDPTSAAWVTGIVWDERGCLAVGAAGYHGPLDTSGMVEIGYRVDPAYRCRGYARAALEALLARAAREPEVRRGAGQHSARQPALQSAGVAVRVPQGRRAVGR